MKNAGNPRIFFEFILRDGLRTQYFCAAQKLWIPSTTAHRRSLNVGTHAAEPRSNRSTTFSRQWLWFNAVDRDMARQPKKRGIFRGDPYAIQATMSPFCTMFPCGTQVSTS